MSPESLSKIVICVSVLMVSIAILNAPVSATKIATVSSSPSDIFQEGVFVFVNCSDATLWTGISLFSPNKTFVGCPSGVNMADSHLLSCLQFLFYVSPTASYLGYIFDTTDTTAAKIDADAITPSIESAFGLSFSFVSSSLQTWMVHPYLVTNVTYSALGIANLPSYYATTLKPLCLKSDLAGFSNAIPDLLNLHPSNSYASIQAQKSSGGYAWQYSLVAGYFYVQIPQGSGYTIDALQSLGVTSLEPSSYAFAETYYRSGATVWISGVSALSFVSCNPSQIYVQNTTRGWYVISASPTWLMAMFYFGNDATPVTVLTFTFNGIIVPEISSLALTIAMIVCTIGIVAFKKCFPKISIKPRSLREIIS